MGLNLAHGGHLSHGSAVNTSGILYHAIGYDLDKETGRVNYDQMEQLAIGTSLSSLSVAVRLTAASGTTSACARLPTKLVPC